MKNLQSQTNVNNNNIVRLWNKLEDLVTNSVFNILKLSQLETVVDITVYELLSCDPFLIQSDVSAPPVGVIFSGAIEVRGF